MSTSRLLAFTLVAALVAPAVPSLAAAQVVAGDAAPIVESAKEKSTKKSAVVPGTVDFGTKKTKKK